MFHHFLRLGAVVALALLLLLTATLAVARVRWNRVTRSTVRELHQSSSAAPGVSNLADELHSVPKPVQRYLRIALRDYAGSVASARIEQEGEFLVRPQPNGWRPFVATHNVATRPPGFVWDARIEMLPGVAVHVRDALVNGSGSMHASIAGLRRVTYAAGTADIAAGALHRYLAEAVWLPTALLPSSGVQWTAIDDSTARATLRDGEVAVSLDFHFGADGLVERVYTPARARAVDNGSVPTAWQGTFSRYERREGLLVPLVGEVSWILPEGEQAYWRGRLTKVSFSPALFPVAAPPAHDRERIQRPPQ